MSNQRDTRRANVNWSIPRNEAGTVSWDGAKMAVLMDIRDELRKLNRLLHCDNFLRIPMKLDQIERNTKKKRRSARPKKAARRGAR